MSSKPYVAALSPPESATVVPLGECNQAGSTKCYSAQIWADFRKYERYDGKLNIKELPKLPEPTPVKDTDGSLHSEPVSTFPGARSNSMRVMCTTGVSYKVADTMNKIGPVARKRTPEP